MIKINKPDLKWAGLIAVAAVLLVPIVQAKHEEQQAKMGYVYTICNNSRQTFDTTSEQTCGQVQDQTNTEFMCDHNDSKPETHCWVEQK